MAEKDEMTRRKPEICRISAAPETTGPSASVDNRIASFRPSYRAAVMSLMAQSPAISDLATSFPALLFALATGYGDGESREAASQAVCQGRPLRDAARRLGIPHWLRRFPPAGLTSPLPQLPDSRALSLRLPPFIPSAPDAAEAWLRRVAYACNAAHEDFAIWSAQIHGQDIPHSDSDAFLWQTAWAWHSYQPALAGHELLRLPWHPGLGLRRANDELAAWRRRIDLHIALSRKAEPDWLREGSALGFDFVRLRNAADFIDESRAMDNCLDQYADQLQRGTRQVYSIRRKQERVADVEISHHHEDRTIPAVIQLRMRGNRRAAAQIWQATYAWFGSQPLKPIVTARHSLRRTAPQRAAWSALWRPYLDWLALRGMEDNFAALVASLSKPGDQRSLRRPARAPTRQQAIT